jgi:DNA-binding transcriptional regulator LsrR (DeoR family)
LIYELLMACRRFGDKKSPGICFINIREAELASRAGLTRETVNRQIHELKSRGLVTVAPNGLTITNVSELEKELAEQA